MCYNIKLNGILRSIGICGLFAVSIKIVPVSIYASAQHVNTSTVNVGKSYISKLQKSYKTPR
jgi:hypothetical protein